MSTNTKNIYQKEINKCVDHWKVELSRLYHEVTGFSKVYNGYLEKSVSVDELGQQLKKLNIQDVIAEKLSLLENENKEMKKEIERMKKKIGGKVKSFEEQINEDKKRVDEMIAEMKKEQLEAKKQNVEIGSGKVTPKIQIGRRQTQRLNQNGNEMEKMKKSVDSLNDSVGSLNDSMKKQEGMNEEFVGGVFV